MKNIILTLLAAAQVFALTPTTGNPLYPAAGIVTEIDDHTDVVTVTMANGNMFEFYGVDDWHEGDVAALIMDDNGTKEVYDDMILDVTYAGTPEILMENERR